MGPGLITSRRCTCESANTDHNRNTTPGSICSPTVVKLEAEVQALRTTLSSA